MSVDSQSQVEAFKIELDQNPFSLPAIMNLAQIYANSGEYSNAICYYEKLIRLDEENGKAWFALGHCYLLMGEYQKCFSAYQRSLYTLSDTRDPQLWYGIGLLYYKFDTYEYAEPAFLAVLRMDPNFEQKSEIMFKLGLIYQKTKRYDSALKYLNMAISEEEEEVPTKRRVEVLTTIGSCLELKGEINSAIQKYNEAIALAEKPNYKVHQHLGYAYYKENKIDEAIAEYLKAIDCLEDQVLELADIKYLMGLSYLKQENFAKSQESFQSAIYKNPNSYIYWVSIGILYAQTTQPHDAFQCFIKASNIYHEGYETWFNMAVLYEQCKQKTEAIVSYQRVYDLNSYYTTALQRKQTLLAQQEVEPPPAFIHPIICISDSTFSVNKNEKVVKTVEDIAKIKSEEKISFPSDINDTKVNIKIEPGLGASELSAGPARTPSTPPAPPTYYTHRESSSNGSSPELQRSSSFPGITVKPTHTVKTNMPPPKTEQQRQGSYTQYTYNPSQREYHGPSPNQQSASYQRREGMPPMNPNSGNSNQLSQMQMPPSPNHIQNRGQPNMRGGPPPMMNQSGWGPMMGSRNGQPGGQGIFPPPDFMQGPSGMGGPPPHMQNRGPSGANMGMGGMAGMGNQPGMNPQMMMMYNYQMMQAYMNGMRQQQHVMMSQMERQASRKGDRGKDKSIFNRESSEDSDDEDSDESVNFDRKKKSSSGGKGDKTKKFSKK